MENILNKIYQIIGIFKKHGAIPSYVISLADDERAEMVSVSVKMSRIIEMGAFFEGDFIQVTRDSESGIEFVICGDESRHFATAVDVARIREENNQLEFLLDLNLTKFLNDTLPESRNCGVAYNASGALVPTREEHDPIYFEPVRLNGSFVGKYRIQGLNNEEVGNLQARVTGAFIGRIVQKTRINIYPHAYNPFCFAIVTANNVFVKLVFWKEHLTLYSSLQVGDSVYVKSFSQRSASNVPDKIIYGTFTESCYFKVKEITPKEVFKVFPRRPIGHREIRLLDTIRGRVVYSSVTLRQTTKHVYQEYLLLRMEDEDGNVFSVLLQNNSQEDFYRLRNRVVELCEMRRIHRGGAELYISSIYTRIRIEDDGGCRTYYNAEENRMVRRERRSRYKEGAIGYLPDNFGRVEELEGTTEIFRGVHKQVDLFYAPVQTTAEELFKAVDEQGPNESRSTVYSLAINEVKKFYFQGVVRGVDETETYVDYLAENEGSGTVVESQRLLRVSLAGDYRVYYAENMFVESEEDWLRLLVNREALLFVDALRVSSDEVLVYLTGGLPTNESQ
ncbi:hypothetical protein ECANGB1_155 [Enterospora canceri]|uniref:Uncharacterized protein n=1 Tax=Enterospora canceri TaxID=1081671 RepID=A0A1Y1S8G5_9MICR|nr:hypothetical protein ECANGB1_155 [Enterospora canceri]